MNRWVEAGVSILECGSCKQAVPYLTFSADTDMTTIGLFQLTSIEHNEIVVTEATGAELQSENIGAETASKANRLLDRCDLRYIPLLRSENHNQSKASFQDFREQYEPPTLFFGCPKCNDGEATLISKMSLTEFRENGGKLNVIPKLEIRDMAS